MKMYLDNEDRLEQKVAELEEQLEEHKKWRTHWAKLYDIEKDRVIAITDERDRLHDILVDISEETDLRNIRGTIQNALKL